MPPCGWRPCRPGARTSSSSRGGSRRTWWGDVELREPDRRRQLREGVDEVVVEPPVARLAALDALLVGEDAALEVELRRVTLDPGGTILELGGDPVGPEIRRLDHVVIDGDDEGRVHGGDSFVGPQYRRLGGAGRSRRR